MIDCQHLRECKLCRERVADLDSKAADAQKRLAGVQNKAAEISRQFSHTIQQMAKMGQQLESKKSLLEKVSLSLKMLREENQNLMKQTIVAERHARESSIKQIQLESKILELKQGRPQEEPLKEKPRVTKQLMSLIQEVDEHKFSIYLLNQVVDYLMNTISGYQLSSLGIQIRPRSFVTKQMPNHESHQILHNLLFVENATKQNSQIARLVENIKQITNFYFR